MEPILGRPHSSGTHGNAYARVTLHAFDVPRNKTKSVSASPGPSGYDSLRTTVPSDDTLYTLSAPKNTSGIGVSPQYRRGSEETQIPYMWSQHSLWIKRGESTRLTRIARSQKASACGNTSNWSISA